MSDDEKRNITMTALYEYEEAKQHLALLRVKGARLAKLAEMTFYLLARGRRDTGHLETVSSEARDLYLKHHAEIEQEITTAAVLAFDDSMLAAIERLKAAESAKKSLGYH